MKSFDPRSGIGSADINTFDFTRCERPDGSAYGTGGKCRQGTESAKAPDVEKLARAGKIRGIDPGAVDRIKAKKLSEARKEARLAVIHQKREVDLLKRERDEAAKGPDKQAAKEARRKHIDAKNKLKELTREHQQARENAGDLRRFGAEQHRYKATAEELQKAYDSGKLSPRTAEKVRVELAQRKAGIVKRAADEKSVEKASSSASETSKSLNKEIRAAQGRARQLQAAGSRLHNVEMDLRNKTNKMDKGFEKNDPKVRERLAKVQAAQERVKKMQDQNIRFRQKLEGPLRSNLTKANDDLERLASEIRRNEGPARAQQMDNLRAKVREIQTIRKRLNEGPGFAPDLGGKGGEPLNVSKIYDQADID